jgi:hypothetical protein
VALAYAAGDPWDAETAAWKAEDVERILNNSPWAKRVPTRIDYVKEDDKSAGGQSSVNKYDRGDMKQGDIVNVVWWSARTPRRAFIRGAQLSGSQFTPEQVQQFAESPRDNYVVVMWGGGAMVGVSGKLPKEILLKGAWLESPRLKKKIQPEDVEVVNDAKGRPERLVFVFPKQVEGQALINPDEKRLLFRWKLPKALKQPANKAEPKVLEEALSKAEQFEAAFEPRKMIARGEQDL